MIHPKGMVILTPVFFFRNHLWIFGTFKRLEVSRSYNLLDIYDIDFA